jgi:hypothetical protein
MRIAMMSAVMLLAVLGCTWVKMAPGGAEVGVARADQNLSACTRRGEVSVSVKDRLGPIGRNELKVRDELETLARNEPPGMGADTVQPKGEPVDGEQRFTAWRCDGAAVTGTAAAAQHATPPAASPGAARPLADGEVETIPLED